MKAVAAKSQYIKMKDGLVERIIKDFKLNYSLYLLVLPVIAYYLIFHYAPMYGAIIAFKKFEPKLGILGSQWIGLENFTTFFSSPYFVRILRNTLSISIGSLLLGFPMPIILALLINELRGRIFSRTVQTISYLPHFISLVVVCSMIKEFTSDQGIINDFIAFLGGERIIMLNEPRMFVGLYILTDIWQEVGWSSIIFLAALAGIDQSLYEAATIDGAGRWKQLVHITLPGIMPIIIVLFILRMGNIMNVGFEKIILLYNPLTYETADVISSYVYRKGIYEMNYSFGAAVDLFNSIINCILLLSCNALSRKFNDSNLY